MILGIDIARVARTPQRRADIKHGLRGVISLTVNTLALLRG